MEKNVVVLGGAGFIGSHLCDRLLQEDGVNVICIDNLITGTVDNIRHLLKYENFKFLRFSINESIDLSQFPELVDLNLEGVGIQEIYNLACPHNPKDFENLREETALSNSLGVINSLKLAVEYKSKYFLASSSVIYGGVEDDAVMFSENDLGSVDTMSPRSAYVEGKRFAESLTATYAAVHNLEIHIGRIFKTYGPRMVVGVGHMVADFIMNALEHKDVLVYGRREMVSSFCYVDDLVEGILKVMQTSNYQLPVNLGSSEAYRIVDIVNQILYLTESRAKVKFEPPLPFMKLSGIPDLGVAKDKIGWFPIISVNEGLVKTIEYTMSKMGMVKFDMNKEKK
jgi:UDP-glucuronate decarboxylase